ncbi:uncharacterized protein KIAA1958 homolog [Geospiza fortis]|uniref:Uncharacterized protein KIAA1958 homolog n=1 Tax=Geospiza fortis TaxID=48883 RepID=A0A6I9ZCZ1_GEOFO|nr:uncharacterized protein KIAA1958 homolog [Geospiza fortis]
MACRVQFSTTDRRCNSTSSLQADLSNLVIWAHTHGTICNQIPGLEFMQNTDHVSSDNSVLWMCRAGHAYHWHCGKSHNTDEEVTEALEGRKRLLSSESLARESSFGEKKLRLTPSSFEMDQEDSGSTGSCGRSQGVTEQKAYSPYTRNNEPKGSQNIRKPRFSAAEQHFSMSGSRVQTGEQDVKSERYEDAEIIISDEEQCEADEDNKGDRISQDNVSEPSAEKLQMHRCQKMALHQPTAPQKTAFAPTCLPIRQAPVSSSEDLSRNILRLAPTTAAGPMAETSRARSLLGSAVPKVCLKRLPVPSTEAKAQLESQTSVMFFELQATAAVQQHLQLSPPECGALGVGSSGDGAENVGKDSETSGSEQTPCSSAFQSPERHPPAASNGDVLKKQEKKKSNTTGYIKVFKGWLKGHHPSETRKIHALPPADLDHYLLSFFSSVKKQNGRDFSANSLNIIRCSISRYLQDHNYQYSILRGPEFKASQEAYKLKCRFLFQKKEEAWKVVENLTDEDVENLLEKGILSKTSPQGLLHLVFTSLVRGFGANTHQHAYQLYWGQVVLRKTKGEVEYLEWKNDLSPKGNEGELNPRLFAKPEDPENCPVSSYKEYARRRPADMLNDNHPLYLAPRSLYSVWDKVWYMRKALSKAKIRNILKVIRQEVRGTVRRSEK